MERSTGTSPNSSLGPPRSGRARLNLWILALVIIGIVVVGVLFSLIYFSTAQINTRTFSYKPQPAQGNSGPYGSILVSDLDGLVSIAPWTKTTLLINGTVTARGLGTSASDVTFRNSSINGNVVFQALFPSATGSSSPRATA